MSKSRSNQQTEEREVVEKFLSIVGIETQPDGIQFLAPPSPDVLCTLTESSCVAFELTEVVDPSLVRSVDFSISVKREMTTYFENMVPSDRDKLEKTFSNADLYFNFEDGTSKSKFRQLLPTLFQLLLECSSDDEGDIQPELLPVGVKRIRIVRGEFVGPMFNASGLALYVADKTVERIKEKFSKRYECDCPVDLLVYSRTRGLQPQILWLGDVQELVARELTQSPFDRVWIFDYVNSAIRYVYPGNWGS